MGGVRGGWVAGRQAKRGRESGCEGEQKRHEKKNLSFALFLE